MPRLFERFHRIEGQAGRTHEGTGIGLALVQELVRLQGGSIRAQSTPGNGSIFTITMPLGSAHLPSDHIGAPRSPASPELHAQAFVGDALRWLPDAPPTQYTLEEQSATRWYVSAGASGDKALVLIADDNADMRDYLRRLLSAGYDVEAVAEGLAALEAARRRRPDLILADVMMPRLDGFGLLRTLRADRELRDVPVILLSARAGEEASVEGLEAGADDYLIKPFSARELLARVRANLDLAALRRHAGRVENELRRQAQTAQEVAEGILASINDGFLALDQDWHFTYVNAAAQRMLGRAATELIGKNYWEEYPANIGTAVETNYRRAMAERLSVAFENYYKPWRQWFDIRVYPARDGGLSVYFQDITGRKHAEDAARRLNETLEIQVAQRTAELQAKEARLRTIFETSYTYQILLALDGTLIDANTTSLAGIAATLEDVVGKPFWDTPWFTGTPGMSETVRRAIPVAASGEIVRQEISVNLPVGGWRWFDFQMRPVRDGQGKIVAILPEAVEVTGRRQAEAALRQAQKMEAIGQLTGGVAHDFNNLLQVIGVNLYLLERRIATGKLAEPDLRPPIEGARRGAERAATLTQRLLAFSRRQPLDPQPLDVNRLVSRMSELLGHTLGESISIQTVLGGGVGRIFSDAGELENALLNLAVNARDAMPDGGKLTIETANSYLDVAFATAQEEVTPGQYVMIAVSDTGTGMTKEVISQAFEPFFTTKDRGQGTGLGLSQVYGFVKQSGGYVRIYSEPYEGTTVKIYMPRFLGESQESTAPVAQSPLPIASAQELILVVEDDDDVRANTTMMLRELGHRVLEAPDGPGALRLLEDRTDVDLLFTDIGLPGGVNGRQLADRARLLRPDLKVLFTSGYALNAMAHQGRLDPGLELLSKPFSFSQLAAKIRQVLKASD
jgi:PAS domain S-box-containing protein